MTKSRSAQRRDRELARTALEHLAATGEASPALIAPAAAIERARVSGSRPRWR